MLSKCCIVVVQSCPTRPIPWTVARQAPLLWNSPGKNTGVGCHSLCQGIFRTQGLNPCLLHCRHVCLFLFLTTEPPGKPLENPQQMSAITTMNSSISPGGRLLVTDSFHRGGNGGSERVSHLPKATQLKSRGARS